MAIMTITVAIYVLNSVLSFVWKLFIRNFVILRKESRQKLSFLMAVLLRRDGGLRHALTLQCHKGKKYSNGEAPNTIKLEGWGGS